MNWLIGTSIAIPAYYLAKYLWRKWELRRWQITYARRRWGIGRDIESLRRKIDGK